MAVTANQSQAEWLSDILAALGGSAGGGAAPLKVQGTAADGAPAVGNPVQIGGVDGSGNTQSLLTSNTGLLGTYSSTSAAIGDGSNNNSNPLLDAGGNGRPCPTYGFLFNNITWDRGRNNHAVTLYSSAARTATPAVAAITNYNGGGFIIFVDVTAGAATPSVTPSLQMVDSVGATPKTVWTAATPITATTPTQFAYVFHPGHATAGTWTEALQMAMPRSTQLTMTHGDADSITYSATVHFLAQ